MDNNSFKDFRHKPEIVDKIWGREVIFSPPIASGNTFCGKILEFNAGSCSSQHFHIEKSEAWYILDGVFLIEFAENGKVTHTLAKLGDCFYITRGLVHKVFCLETGRILEASTKDQSWDNFRLDESSEFKL